MRNKFPDITVSPGVILFVPLMLLVIPFPWVVATMCSILLHELCHITAAKLFGKRIFCFSIGSSGAAIQTDNMNHMEEMIVALAGPASCIIPILLARHFPRLAVCSVVHSVYNLLPLNAFDGSRVLRCLTSFLLPPKFAQQVYKIVETVCVIFIIIILIGATIILKIGFLSVFVMTLFVIKLLRRKKSCKGEQLRVQ